jgi:hypothetical protein
MAPHWQALTLLLCKLGICATIVLAAGVTQIATFKSLLTLLGGQTVEQRS